MAKNLGNFTIIDHSKTVLKLSKQAKWTALTKIAIKWDETVVAAVPVDTGNLRNSRGYKVSDNSVDVGFTANYATYVELGTRKQAAQPYLRPSIENNVSVFKKIVEKEFKNG